MVVATQLCQVAADFATRHHPGAFADLRLERLLRTISSSTVLPQSPNHRSGVLLQVVSPGSRSEIESFSATCAIATPLTSMQFMTDPTDLVGSARRLRQVAGVADLVIVHAEADDIVPSLALAGWQNRPPVVHVNHHDTTFWVGVGVSDLLVSHRATGSALAVDRRFVSPGRTVVAPDRGVSTDVWRDWFGDVARRVGLLHRAWLPEAHLPAPVTSRDLELVEIAERCGRADGLRGSFARHGATLDSPDRPRVSLVIVGHSVADTLDCLDDALESLREEPVQLLVVDASSGDDLWETMSDLAGIVTMVDGLGTRDDIEAAAIATRWCSADITAVVSDRAELLPGALVAGLELAERSSQPVGLEAIVPFDGVTTFAARTAEIDGWLELVAVAGRDAVLAPN